MWSNLLNIPTTNPFTTNQDSNNKEEEETTTTTTTTTTEDNNTANNAVQKFTQNLTLALEKAGESVTQQATAHVRRHRQTQQEKEDQPKTSPTNTKKNLPFIENWKKPLLFAKKEENDDKTETATKDSTAGDEMLSQLKSKWGSVVEATLQVVETTKEVVEKEHTRMSANLLFRNGPYKRDIAQELDVDALCDAEVCYLTDRIITMAHPYVQSATDGDITPDRKLSAIVHLLQKRHGPTNYMIWNLSELDYDYSFLEDQVLSYKFPGSPSPPLGLLLKILMGMESWLKADSKNVAIVHCLTGRGRSSSTVAAFLCWIGEAGFGDSGEKSPTRRALEYISKCKNIKGGMDVLTIPSQRRYMNYFENMMDEIRPSQPPLLLKRIIMSEAPKFGKCPKSHNNTKEEEERRRGQVGCAPYIQIFKAGKLVFTTTARTNPRSSLSGIASTKNESTDDNDDLPFVLSTDGSITFPIETIVQGDVLIRCRHLTRRGQRVSMFRAAIHTGYIPPKVLRLTKSELDGAHGDARYNDDFFLDVLFEECDASMASKHIVVVTDDTKEEQEQEPDATTKNKNKNKKDDSTIRNEAAARRMKGTVAGSETATTSSVTDTDGTKTNIVTASAYDSMLHRDSRFWEIISKRREETRKRAQEEQEQTKNSSSEGGSSSEMITPEMASFYGPTIGRRREFEDELSNEDGKNKSNGGGDEDTKGNNGGSTDNSIHSFSIGGEFDFKEAPSKVAATIEKEKVQKKDDLMEALMAIDDEVENEFHVSSFSREEVETEEVIFEEDDDNNNNDGGNKDSSTKEEGIQEVTKPNETTATVAGSDTDSAVLTATPDDKNNDTREEGSGKESLDEDESLVEVKMGDSVVVVEEDEMATTMTALTSDIVASKVEKEESGGDDGDTGEVESFDFDEEDEDLEDLENFLMKAKGK